jgi:hypothetical protein
MSEYTTQNMSIAELQAALRMERLIPRAGSPIFGLRPATQLDEDELSALTAKGIVGPDDLSNEHWRNAFAAVAAPAHRLALCLGSAQGSMEVDYCSGAEGLVAYSGGQGRCAITFPIAPAAILSSCQSWLRWQEVPDCESFRADLRVEEATVLAAAVDACREENLRALIDRRASNAGRFSREQLDYELQLGRSRADLRWWSGLLWRHAPPAHRPDPGHLDAGAQFLAERGWLRFEDGSAVAGPAVETLCRTLGDLHPYLFVSVGPAAGNPVSLLVTSGPQCFWTQEFLMTNEGLPWVRLQGLGGPGAGNLVQGYLALLRAG